MNNKDIFDDEEYFSFDVSDDTIISIDDDQFELPLEEIMNNITYNTTSASIAGSISTTWSNSIAGSLGSVGSGSGSYVFYPSTISTPGIGYTGSASSTVTITSPSSFSTDLTVKGDAHFDGDVKIQGVSLSSRLDEIEKRLAILRPNTELEEKWETLKRLGEEYRKLEKEIIDGEKAWDILKR